MKRKLSLSVTLLLVVFSSSSFKPLVQKDCNPSVSVYAVGANIELVRVTINGVNHSVSITNGEYQIFSDPNWTQGTTITVQIACAGGGSHTRMRSIFCQNSGQCIIYPNYVTTATITETKPCAALLITASTVPACP